MSRLFYRFLIITLVSTIIFSACKPPEIKDGQVAYNLKKYNLATELLREDYNKAGDNSTKARLAWQIAQSYKFINNTQAAGQWYEQAHKDGYGLEARVQYARMLMSNEKYDEAIKEFEQMVRDEPFRRAEFSTYITAAQQAMEWRGQQSHTNILNLSINSAKADFSPVFYENNALIFSSSRAGATGDEQDLWTGDLYYDLFISQRDANGSLTTSEKFTPNINSEFNDGTMSFNADFTQMYFTQCGSKISDVNDFCNIYFSTRLPDGGWSQPELIKLFSDSINVGHPVISKDGNTLIYAAADKQGYGGTDLFFSVKNFEGWSSPINLGSAINTAGNEAFPYLDQDGNLYFSSDGLPGMGGLDIFTADYVGNKWTNVRNLRYPINSGADDFGVIIEPLTASEKENFELRGYFTSSRSGGQGSDDIYYFVREKAPAKFILAGKVMEKRLQDPQNPNSQVLGLDPLRNATVLMYRKTSGGEQFVDTLKTANDGSFSHTLEANSDYRLFASKEPEYFSKSEQVSTKNKPAKKGETVTVNTEIVLDKIFASVEIVIPNIYYDYNEYFIRPDAAAVLDTTILPLMLENPTLVVEIGSHTDSRGTDSYNLKLSQQRATSVIEYLAKKGIDPQRLKAKGYGETRPTNRCVNNVDCTEEEFQRNRRTTFKVLSDKFDVQSVEPENIQVDPKK